METTFRDHLVFLIAQLKKRELQGLCLNAQLLKNNGLISYQQYLVLKEFIKRAKPYWFQKRYYCNHGVKEHKKYPEIQYYWDPNDYNSRIKYLEKAIAKLK